MLQDFKEEQGNVLNIALTDTSFLVIATNLGLFYEIKFDGKLEHRGNVSFTMTFATRYYNSKLRKNSDHMISFALCFI